MITDDILLTDQVAVVTGGGGGIGRGIALSLAEAGADLVIADILPERCEEVAAQVRARGRRALAFPIDMLSVDQIDALIARTQAEFGRLDILVNNVGGVRRQAFLDQKERSWRRHIDLNLVSVIAATSAAVPVMIAGGRGGSIINITSIEASRAAPNFAVYAACKAGVENLTRTLAVELAEHGIRINAIAPDIIDTPGTRGLVTGSADPADWPERSAVQLKTMAHRIPLGRIGGAEECGRAAAFLASRMSAYMTGTVLRPDGGSWASSGWTRSYANRDWVLSETAPADEADAQERTP